MTLADVSTTQRLVLAAGTTLGVVAMTVALWPSLRAIGFRWRLRFDWRHETIRRLLHLARWVALYVVVNQIAYFFIIVFNGRVPGGGYAVYSQAFIFFSPPHAIVAVLISPRCRRASPDAGPTATSAAARALLAGAPRHRGGDAARRRRLRGARGTDRHPARELRADDRGRHPAARSDARGVRRGLPFFSAFQLLTRTFYATQDTRTPALANIAVAW